MNYIKVVKTTKKGIAHLHAVLKEKASRITQAALWRIPHHNQTEDVRLKIGRYEKKGFELGSPETEKPKSELTLDNEELKNLIGFLAENYEPFRQGIRRYVPIGEQFNPQSMQHLRAFFANKDTPKTLEFIAQNKILSDELITGLRYQQRVKAVKEFEAMLEQGLREQNWQKWFRDNDWILGSEFVRVLDEREVDTAHITDYLMQAYDGFLDIIEIKRPESGLRFWSETPDHGNYIPSTDLVKAVTQATSYIHEVEHEANSVKFLDRVGVKVIKPRCILIYGRSDDWNEEQKQAYRILNASYHNLTILTYDHVLERAKRIVANKEEKPPSSRPIPQEEGIRIEDIPF